jgi:hypothetical protein
VVGVLLSVGLGDPLSVAVRIVDLLTLGLGLSLAITFGTPLIAAIGAQLLLRKPVSRWLMIEVADAASDMLLVRLRDKVLGVLSFSKRLAERWLLGRGIIFSDQDIYSTFEN